MDIFISHCALRFHCLADLLNMSFPELRYFYRLARQADKWEKEAYR